MGMRTAAIVAGMLVATGATAGAPGPTDCCSPEAMRRVAGSAGFIDIAGIKPGMTPEQAFSAVKTFNPGMKIDIINARLEPGDAPGTYKRVPQFALAHTVGPVRNPYQPVRFDAADGSSDVILMEFTLPPSPPLVGQVIRTVTFAKGQPVVVSNLLAALRKKYGQETLSDSMSRVWAFDENGKLFNRLLTRPESSCLSGTPFDLFGYVTQMPTADDLSHDAPIPVSLINSMLNLTREQGVVCRNLTFARNYGLGESMAPNREMTSMTIAIASPALLYGSRQATHDWLQAQRDGKAQKENQAAEQRAAPKL